MPTCLLTHGSQLAQWKEKQVVDGLKKKVGLLHYYSWFCLTLNLPVFYCGFWLSV